MIQEYFSQGSEIVQIKKGGFNFLGEPIVQNVWIIWSSLLYLGLKSPMDQKPLTVIRFQFFLHESGRIFSGPLSFYKLRIWYLISGVNQFCKTSELFAPLFSISILKVF